MPTPDLTIFFSREVADWDRYLSTWFENNSNEAKIIAHEILEDIIFPLSPSSVQNFANARVVLVIISPAFLDVLNHNFKNILEIGSLLKPKWTVAMLCGVQQTDVTASHRDALVSYDKWLHLIAKHRDSTMVSNMIKEVQSLLIASCEKDHTLKLDFKFVPLKVQEGKGKVYIIFKKLFNIESKKIKVFLNLNVLKEVPAKQINPYNWQFHIPDSCMSRMRLLNVHVYQGEDLIGIRQIKCESKMGELSNVLSANNSPYEFMCTTLGMASLHDVDEHLAKMFRKLMPPSGLPFVQSGQAMKWKKSKDEIPTLLHFAARYGMIQLTKEILQCPFAHSACFIKNEKDLSPVQIAGHHAHYDVAKTLSEYQKAMEFFSKNTVPNESTILALPTDNSRDSALQSYAFPPTNPIPISTSKEQISEQTSQTSDGYVNISSPMHSEPVIDKKSSTMVHEQDIIGKQTSCEMEKHLDSFSASGNTETDFLKSQSKLIEIIKSYKRGASLVEVERMQNEWKSNCQVSDDEAKQPLEILRNMYAKAQKPKLNKSKSSSFSELRQFIGSKLRRKSSVSSKSNISFSQQAEVFDTVVRPMSTLSVTSNTSSSSASSFLSSASAGTDSGNHSDNYEERNRCKETNFFDAQKNHLSLNGKPPAPPPRPAKTYIKPNTLPVCSESSSQRFALRQMSQMPSKPNSALPGSISLERKYSLSSNFRDVLDGYDIPPLPRQHRHHSLSSTASGYTLESMNYDLVPPPLPLSSKPSCTCYPKFPNMQLYDTPSSSLPKCFLAEYDFPKIDVVDHAFANADIANYDFPKVDVADYDFPKVDTADYDFPKTDIDKKAFSLKEKDSNDIYMKVSKSKNVKNSTSESLGYENVTENDASHVARSGKNTTDVLRPQYSNILQGNLEDIPDEVAPPPPDSVENTEDHYKIVGIPVPVPKSGC